MLSVRWDRAEIAKPILAQLAERSPGKFTSAHQRALQTALALERVARRVQT